MVTPRDRTLAKLTKVEYIKICIKERLKGADFPPSVCELSDKRVEITILHSLCDDKSSIHYHHYIHEFARKEIARYDADEVPPLTRSRKNNLAQLIATTPSPKCDETANILINYFKETWRTLADALTDQSTRDQDIAIYIHLNLDTIQKARKQSNQKTRREQAREHRDIMNTLMDLLRRIRIQSPADRELCDRVHKPLSQLLSLAYCILQFCYNRAQQPGNPKLSYIQLREFLSDMVITFLLLKSVCVSKHMHYEGFCKLTHNSLPEIEKVKIHLNISPNNPVFKELVLWGILKVLYGDQAPRTVTVPKEADTQDERVKYLAKSVHSYFSIYPFKSLKTADTLCCIICNQSRYMAIGSPLLKEYVEDNMEEKIMKLHKNFVSEKTAYAVFEKARRVPCIRHVISDEMDTESFVMSCNDHSVTEQCNKDCAPIRYPIKLKRLEEDLNILHHAILVNAVYRLHTFLERPSLQLDEKLWFIDNSCEKGRMMFKEMLKGLVRRLIAKYRQNQDYGALYKLMSNFALSLQYIIYIRWLVCEIFYQSGIGMNTEGAKHQEIVFLFLALRTLIMYLLPVRYYSVNKLSSDSTKLAKYASRLQFKLDIYCPQVYKVCVCTCS